MFILADQEGNGLHAGLKRCLVYGMTFSNYSDACLRVQGDEQMFTCFVQFGILVVAVNLRVIVLAWLF